MTSHEGRRYAKSAAQSASEVPGTLMHLLAQRVPPAKTLLDIGCGSGDVGEVLVGRGLVVDGIEADPERASIARQRLRHVQTGVVGSEFKPEGELLDHYDAILFIDVIEHLVDPGPVLVWAREHLSAEGRILAFIPNSAFLSFRLRMLRGDWHYDESGFFDRDHVRFYDPDTMRDIPSSAGLIETNRWPVGRFYPWVRGRNRLLGLFPRLLASSVLVEWCPN